MKRAAIATAATIVGLILLLGFKTGPAPPATLRPSAQAPATPGPRPRPTPPPSGAPAGVRTLTGQPEQIPFGVVQVQLRVKGRRIESVTVLEMPNDNPTSAQISQAAAPQLEQEVLTAQSANIDVVSGATFTSDGYAQSLQSALDQLRG